MRHLQAAVLSSCLAASATLSIPASAATLKILPLGDSITVGYPVVPGYRKFLYDRLVADGHTVDMVGTQQDSGSAWAESQHEGHGGWSPTQLAQVVAQNVIETLAPDFVLLMAGTNGITMPGDPNVGPLMTADALKILIDDITRRRPEAWVIVSNLPQSPQGCPDGEFFFELFVRTYNELLPGVMQDLANQGKKVALVDLHTGIGCNARCDANRTACTSPNMADHVHPNEGGYRVMAASWYQAIRAALAGTLMTGSTSGIDAGVSSSPDGGAPMGQGGRGGTGGFAGSAGGSSGRGGASGAGGTGGFSGTGGAGGRAETRLDAGLAGTGGATTTPLEGEDDVSGCACTLGRSSPKYTGSYLAAGFATTAWSLRRRRRNNAR